MTGIVLRSIGVALVVLAGAAAAQAEDLSSKADTGFKFWEHFRSVTLTTIPKYKAFTNGKLEARFSNENYSLPESMRVGDFNNDGLDDVVLVFGDTLMKPLFFISSGDGSFQQSMTVPDDAARRHIRNIALADLNHDGFLDFVGFAAPHDVHQAVLGPAWGPREPDLILINQGGKGFVAIKGIASGFHHGGAVGDLNGDGLLDVFGLAEFPKARGNPYSDALRAPLLQGPNLTFTKAKTGLGHLFDSALTSDMRIGDLNGDGKADYVVALAPLLPGLGGPNGTPMASSKAGALAYAYGDGTGDVSKLKWNVIGKHWMDEETWKIFLKNYDHNRNGRSDYKAGPSNVELLDVDGDGRLDILMGFYVAAPIEWRTSEFKYFHNNGNGFDDLTDTIFPSQSANRDVVNPIDVILGFNLADLNGDGAPDLLVTDFEGDDVGQRPNSFSVFLNHGGVFYPILRNSFRIGFEFKLARTGDFNGDGRADIVSIVEQPSEFLLLVELNTGK